MTDLARSDLDLLRLRIDALFVEDGSGRLLSIREPEPSQPAPRLFLSRTRDGNLWRVRYDLPEALAAELDRLAADEPVSGDLDAPPRHAAAYAELLRPVVSIERGLAYALPELDAPERAVMITAENFSLTDAHFGWLAAAPAAYAPVAAVVVDGDAVAICFSARITARVAEAGVYTEAAYRGRGYATDTVRGWAAGIRATGRLPLYSTSRENRASQRIAGRLGARQYGADFSVG